MGPELAVHQMQLSNLQLVLSARQFKIWFRVRKFFLMQKFIKLTHMLLQTLGKKIISKRYRTSRLELKLESSKKASSCLYQSQPNGP